MKAGTHPIEKPQENLALTIRIAIRKNTKMDISYLDEKGQPSKRTIWPFALAFFDSMQVLVAWCELRQGYRSFRIDRIQSWEISQIRYPRNRNELVAEWLEEKGFGRDFLAI